MHTAETRAAALNVHWIREQFPALKFEVGGRPAVFFDGPGGTQVSERVIAAVVDYYRQMNANTHGTFLTSQHTDAMIAGAHAAMADLLGCGPDEVVFGANMTTLTFALSRAIGRELREGDEIVVTALDHEANVGPWRALEERGVVIRVADFRTEDCTLDLDDLARKVTERTRLVAVGYASNAVGTINPVREIIRLAHERGALVFIDAVHYAPHGLIDVRALDCDFLACSVYKFFGPHAGVLYGKREHLERLKPYELRVASDELPDRWETGSQNHEGMAGTMAAVDYLVDVGRQNLREASVSRREALRAAYAAIHDYEHHLAETMLSGLQDVPGLTLYGIRDRERLDQRTPTFAVRLNGRTPMEVAAALGAHGIFTWEGNYYAIGVTERLGLEDRGGMLRIGLVHYNTVDEIERLLLELNRLAAR